MGQSVVASVRHVAWTLLVMASALLIKRHVVIDIVAGAALGAGVYAVLFRAVAGVEPDSEPVMETLRIRTKLAREMAAKYAALAQHDWRARFRELATFIGLAAAGMALSIWRARWDPCRC